MSDPQKTVLKVQLNCEKCKQRALKTVADIKGVESVAVDKDSKLIVTGNPDPVRIAKSLRKYGYAEILSFGPAEEPAKPKPEPQKPEPSKDPPKPEPPIVLIVPECNYFSEENANSCVIC